MKKLLPLLIVGLVISPSIIFCIHKEMGDLSWNSEVNTIQNDNIENCNQAQNRGKMNADIVKSYQKISDTEGSFMGSLNNSNEFGVSSTNIGDLDNDSVIDIAVGASNDGGGAVWILFLNSDGTVKGHQKISDKEGGFTGILDGWDRFGASVSALGDLDGDGVTDLAVGAYRDDNIGAVWILFLNSNGTVKGHQKISKNSGNFSGNISGLDHFGKSIANIGDLNGDNVNDIAVGHPLDDDGGKDKGAVWILFLNSNGTVRSHQKISETNGNFTDNLSFHNFFGWSITCIGDLNGDNINDIAVGASTDGDGGINRGALWILFLNINGTVKLHQKISDQEGDFNRALNDGDLFGSSVSSIGDLNDDGVTDIAVGAIYCDDGGWKKGAVWILFLCSNGTVKSYQNISDVAGGFEGRIDQEYLFGASVLGLGDLDNDGILDIAIGAKWDGNGGTRKGAVWILFLANDNPSFDIIWNNTLTTGDLGVFSANITDELNGLNEVWFNFSIDNGKYSNWSVNNCTGDSWWINITLPDNATFIEFIFWANDTLSNQGMSDKYQYDIIDDDIPSLLIDNSKKLCTTGDNFTFNISALDNIQVDTIYINWTHGGEIGNKSLQLINRNWIGTIRLDHDLEDLTYKFFINDTSNNYYIGNMVHVSIIDNDAPVFQGDYSQQRGTTGDTFLFNISALDNIAVDQVDIYWNHGSIKDNLSLIKTGDFWIGNITVDHAVEPLVYFLFIQDASCNYNLTNLTTVNITDNDDPEFLEDLTSGTPTTGDRFTFQVSVLDNVNIYEVYLRCTFKGQNIIYDRMIPDKNYFIKEVIIPYQTTSFGYSVNISDGAGNWHNESREDIRVIDNDAPSFYDLTTSSATTGEEFDIYLNVTDNIEVNSVFVRYSFNNGTQTNETMLNVGASLWNITISIPSNASQLDYSFHINDTTDNTLTTDVFTYSIVDNDNPQANAGPDIHIAQHENVTFNGIASIDNIDIYDFIWTFRYNDTNHALKGEVVNFRFDQAGTFNISINVSDSEGNWDCDYLTVIVRDITPPIAEAGNNYYIDQGEPVLFSGSRSIDNTGISNYSWYFTYQSIDIILYGIDANFTFNIVGYYDITLKVTDIEGNQHTDNVEVIVRDVMNPIAAVTIDEVINQFESVIFNGKNSSDNVGVVDYAWTFMCEGINIRLYGNTSSFTFNIPGIYNISLSVSDDAGNGDTCFFLLTVRDTEMPIIEVTVNGNPLLNNYTSGKGVMITFYAGESTDNVGIVNWTWMINNEKFYREIVNINFKKSGIYNLTLKVSDAEGNYNETVFQIEVKDSDSVDSIGSMMSLGIGGFIIFILIMLSIFFFVTLSKRKEKGKGRAEITKGNEEKEVIKEIDESKEEFDELSEDVPHKQPPGLLTDTSTPTPSPLISQERQYMEKRSLSSDFAHRNSSVESTLVIKTQALPIDADKNLPPPPK